MPRRRGLTCCCDRIPAWDRLALQAKIVFFSFIVDTGLIWIRSSLAIICGSYSIPRDDGTCKLWDGVNAAASSWLNLVGRRFMSTNWNTVDLRFISDSSAHASKFEDYYSNETSDLWGHDLSDSTMWLLWVLGNCSSDSTDFSETSGFYVHFFTLSQVLSQ